MSYGTRRFRRARSDLREGLKPPVGPKAAIAVAFSRRRPIHVYQRLESPSLSLHACNMSRARRSPSAIIAGLMLVVSAAGCGGRAGDADAAPIEGPGPSSESGPRRPVAGTAPMSSSSAASVDGAPTVTPEILPTAPDDLSRRERYVSAFQSVA